MSMSPHVRPTRAEPARALRAIVVLTVLGSVALAARHHRNRTTAAEAHLQRDAAMMSAGIDADQRTVLAAISAGDSAALDVARASLRERTTRLSRDLSALRIAEPQRPEAAMAAAHDSLPAGRTRGVGIATR